MHAGMRDELLNDEIFHAVREARIIIEQWRRHYLAFRLHSVLNYKPPAPECFISVDRRPTAR